MNALLGDPLTLPCGAVLKNRIAKAAMSDSLGDGNGNATDAQARLYERWALGGVGLSLIGEVQIDPRYPEKPGNLIADSLSDKASLLALSSAGSADGTMLWAQLGHAGALADPDLTIGKGPSALAIGDFRCEAMTLEDIEMLPEQFAESAGIMKALGFGGVEIHAGHGFLLSQFLSPLFNLRTDNYGGDIEARSRLVLEVIDAVRSRVGADFPIGVKLNSSDGLRGGLSEDDAIAVVRLLDSTSIDLIDISGGTYFPGAKSASDRGGSGPYFISFARRARQHTNIPLMVTGGFKRKHEALQALSDCDADIIGLARALAIDPRTPHRWMQSVSTGENAGEPDPVFPQFDVTQDGGITAWYTMHLTALANDSEDEMSLDIKAAAFEYKQRDASRRKLWRQRLVKEAAQ